MVYFAYGDGDVCQLDYFGAYIRLYGEISPFLPVLLRIEGPFHFLTEMTYAFF